jgi:hypothetical protein
MDNILYYWQSGSMTTTYGHRKDSGLRYTVQYANMRVLREDLRLCMNKIQEYDSPTGSLRGPHMCSDLII